MNFWNEDEVEEHLTSGNQKALASDFLRLSRWIIAKEVRSPRWVDREDLVQIGVTCCLKAIQKNTPDRPRFPYFAQVVKNETRRAVTRACRQEVAILPGEDHEAPPSEIVETMIRSEAGRTFPAIRDALVLAHRMGRVRTRACIADLLKTTGRPGSGRAFAAMLQEELQ